MNPRTITPKQLCVSWIWLWRETGWAGYDANTFHGLSLNHAKHRLPVIRAVPGHS
jgi:hypothetical protein